VILVACTPETDPALHFPTATFIPPTGIPTTTLTPTITPTPQPTLSSNAITAQTAARLDKAFWITENGGSVLAVAVSPDGSLVATGGTDWVVRIFDGYTGELLARQEHHRHNIYTMMFSPDGKYLLTGSRDTTIQQWDAQTGERVGGVRTAGQVKEMDYSPDGTAFAQVGLFTSVGEVIQHGTLATLFSLEGHSTRLRSVAYSPDGQYLATGDENGVIVIHNPADGVPLFSISGVHGEATALAFSPDGINLAVGNTYGEIEMWNLEQRSFAGKWFGHVHGVERLIYTRDGTVLISSGGDGSIRLWDPISGEKIIGLTGQGGAVGGLSLSRDGSTLISGSTDGTAIVWRLLP
jgi:WD40 repeat protein